MFAIKTANSIIKATKFTRWRRTSPWPTPLVSFASNSSLFDFFDEKLCRSDAKLCSRLMRHTVGLYTISGGLAFWVLCRLHYEPTLSPSVPNKFNLYIDIEFIIQNGNYFTVEKTINSLSSLFLSRSARRQPEMLIGDERSNMLNHCLSPPPNCQCPPPPTATNFCRLLSPPPVAAASYRRAH
ncbi:hypothetical protein Scep_028038 [Stephania cephalantha]|uniref:DUF7875 domain-containing protein n=1 Tax=Stephania cephalantha TaxID=152367 RepID=A0AAP0E959_9MAGN